MDGHYFLAGADLCCPLDGAYSEAAEDVARPLPTIGEPVTLAALARAGLPEILQGKVLVAELPDAVAPPWLLRPWFEGDQQPK
jgi:hypothetical protein